MGYRPSTANCDDSPTLLIDQQLGEAYEHVKTVSDNIAIIESLGAQITGLTLIANAITELQYLITQIDNLTTISGEIADLTPLITNINSLVAIHGSMADLLELHGDLDALNSLYTNMSAIITELTTVAGIAAELTAVAGNASNINIVAGLESAINALPGLVTAAQNAAAQAVAAAESLNLPIAGPSDGGKYLVINPDTLAYVLQTLPAFMDPDTYDPQGHEADAFSADNHDDGTINKVYTATERTKLAAIEAAADVTDALNVGAAINGSTAKTEIVDTDHITGINTTGNVLTKWSWANIKATLKAAAAEVYSSAANKFLTTDMIATASVYVTMTDSAAPELNWESGINRSLTLSQSAQIQNPTNGRPGTHRTILIKGANSTPRSVIFGNQFLGELPEIDDLTDTKWYDVTIKCLTPVHFTAVAMVARQ